MMWLIITWCRTGKTKVDYNAESLWWLLNQDYRWASGLNLGKINIYLKRSSKYLSNLWRSIRLDAQNHYYIVFVVFQNFSSLLAMSFITQKVLLLSGFFLNCYLLKIDLSLCWFIIIFSQHVCWELDGCWKMRK